LLEQALGAGIVGPHARRLPAAVVARWVAEVELELTLGIPTGIDEGDAERPQTTMLGIALLQVTDPPHKLLAWNVFIVGQKVFLGCLAGVIDQNVGVGYHAGNGANHVVVKDVQLLG
jgi:hypothetical protein